MDVILFEVHFDVAEGEHFVMHAMKFGWMTEVTTGNEYPKVTLERMPLGDKAIQSSSARTGVEKSEFTESLAQELCGHALKLMFSLPRIPVVPPVFGLMPAKWVNHGTLAKALARSFIVREKGTFNVTLLPRGWWEAPLPPVPSVPLETTMTMIRSLNLSSNQIFVNETSLAFETAVNALIAKAMKSVIG